MTESHQEQIAKLIALMVHRPMSRDELRLFSGMQQSTVDKWIKAFRDHKLVYIADYAEDAMGRFRIHKYLFDPGKSDVPVKIAKQRFKERTQA